MAELMLYRVNLAPSKGQKAGTVQPITFALFANGNGGPEKVPPGGTPTYSVDCTAGTANLVIWDSRGEEFAGVDTGVPDDNNVAWFTSERAARHVARCVAEAYRLGCETARKTILSRVVGTDS